jgi:hypothetical protein
MISWEQGLKQVLPQHTPVGDVEYESVVKKAEKTLLEQGVIPIYLENATYKERYKNIISIDSLFHIMIRLHRTDQDGQRTMQVFLVDPSTLAKRIKEIFAVSLNCKPSQIHLSIFSTNIRDEQNLYDDFNLFRIKERVPVVYVEIN